MEAGAQQRRRGRGRCGNNPGNRTTRARGVSGGNSGSVAGRPISSFPGEAAIHTESRWEAAAIGDTDGAGPSGADGSEACGGLEAWEGELRIPGMHVSQEAEHPAKPSLALHAAMAKPKGDEETSGSRPRVDQQAAKREESRADHCGTDARASRLGELF